MIVVLNIGHWGLAGAEIEVAVENAQDLTVELTAAGVLKGFPHERIKPTPTGVGLIRVVNRIVAIVGQVLNHE